MHAVVVVIHIILHLYIWIIIRVLSQLNNSIKQAVNVLRRKIKQGDTIRFILDMGITKLYYYLSEENSNIRVLTNSIKTGADIKYAFAISMIPDNVSCGITVIQKFIKG